MPTDKRGKEHHGYKHGMVKTRFYYIWQHMKARCLLPSCIAYPLYGGRGVELCHRWREFQNFYEDMHLTYRDDLTIDRINPDGDYTPENCRWASIYIQGLNKRCFKTSLNFRKLRNGYESRISVANRSIHLGLYETPDEAKAVHREAEKIKFAYYNKLQENQISASFLRELSPTEVRRILGWDKFYNN